MKSKGAFVVKIGSSTLVDRHGAPDRPFIADLCQQLVALKCDGWQPVLVSSGAAAAGVERLGLPKRPTDIETLQACCAAGQASLMEIYAEELSKLHVACGQILITRKDIVDRKSYLNVRNTMERLLELGVIPIVNENDTVSVSEFTFGDNDMLGAIVATIVYAKRYVILSDVVGLYDQNPATHPEAHLIPQVSQITPEIAAMAGGAGSAVGTGGMKSKLKAARVMLACGIEMVICEGRRSHVLTEIAQGKAIGTRFAKDEPASNHERGRKLWIGLAGIPHGTLIVDAGAQKALTEQGSSLLPVGVVKSEGTYGPGDIVDIQSLDGTLLARGLARYSSAQMEKFRALHLDVIARFLDGQEPAPAVHRDEMLVF